MSFPFSIAYPTQPKPRPYGPITANTNFCETDHLFSSTIAELLNTLSNTLYVIYSIHGLTQLYRRRTLTFQTALPHIGIFLVGVSSAWYHSTLLKGPQLADEISMAMPTGAVVSRLVSFRLTNPTTRSLVYWGMIAAVTTVYVLHIVFFLNWIHYPAFGGMVFYVGRRCLWLIKHRVADPHTRRVVKWRARQGEILFLGAFAIWLVDRFFCTQLNALRTKVGLPWGWLLELHAWWHVGTAMGAYAFVQVAEYLMDETEEKTGDPGSRLDPFALWKWKSASASTSVSEDQAVVNGKVKRG